jgi:hypothetical protein
VWGNKHQLVALVVLLCLNAIEACVNADEAPSEEFLEYLGEFQTQDGEWIDPLNLQEVKQADIQQSQSDQTEVKRDSEDKSDE